MYFSWISFLLKKREERKKQSISNWRFSVAINANAAIVIIETHYLQFSSDERDWIIIDNLSDRFMQNNSGDFHTCKHKSRDLQMRMKYIMLIPICQMIFHRYELMLLNARVSWVRLKHNLCNTNTKLHLRVEHRSIKSTLTWIPNFKIIVCNL